jgi:hypothetical protein
VRHVGHLSRIIVSSDFIRLPINHQLCLVTDDRARISNCGTITRLSNYPIMIRHKEQLFLIESNAIPVNILKHKINLNTILKFSTHIRENTPPRI